MDIRDRSFLLAPSLAVLLAASPAQALIAFGGPQALNSTATTDSDDESDDDVDHEVSLATDGSSNWVAAWSSDNSLGNTIGLDSDILVATSSDDGETWSPTEAAMADAFTDGSAPDTSPRVAGGNGVFVLVFSSSNTLGGTKGSDDDILFSRSTDNGANWTNAALLNSGGLSDLGQDLDHQPSIATDGAGNWVVVWKLNGLSPPTGDQTFFSYSTDDGMTWAPEQPLGALRAISVGNGQGTSVAWNGTAYVVVWGSSENLGSNGNDGDILVSIVTPPGYLASAPALLNDNGTTDSTTGPDTFPGIAANGTTLVVAWESAANVGGSGTDHDILFSRSTNGGTLWSPAAPLASNATVDTGEDSNVAVANDGSTFLAVWDSNSRLDNNSIKDRDILVARSDDGGASWGTTAVLATNATKDRGEDIEPAIAASAASGTWNVAWETTDTLGKTLGGDEDLLFVHSAEECPALPVSAAGCFQPTAPGTSALIIKEAGAKDSFLWKFAKGPLVDKAADIGNPSSTDDYVLCIYDQTAGTPQLLIELDLEAGGNCFVNPCWTDVGTGYTYKHKFGAVAAASLLSGSEGTSKASVKAKVSFRAPPLPLSQGPTVNARLHNLANGKCFATDFSTSNSNTPGLFKAKSD